MLPDNLGYIFDAALKLTPGAAAVLQGDTQLTFAELDERCNRMANALVSLGVKVGDRVALMFTNDYRFLQTCLGTMRLGAVPVPLNIRMGDDALVYVIDNSEANTLIVNSEMVSRAQPILARLTSVKHIIVDGAKIQGTHNYAALLQTASPRLGRRTTDPDEICMQPYTSGSTGKPKGVMLTHRGQIWNADIVRKAGALDHTERALVAVPLYHKNAMIGAVKPVLLAGGSIVILPGFDALGVIKAIDRYRITYMSGVPAMYKMILAEREALRKYDMRSLRYATCGSAEVPQELIAEFQKVFRNAVMAETYGLTEGGPVPIIPTRWGLKRRGSCGQPIPGCDVRIVDTDGLTDLGANEVGEFITRNPGLAKGYWKLPEVTARRFRDGWLFTGDLMRRDEDGFYYFVGRKDDMINVSGENVYPKEIEDILLRHMNVRDACVVSTSHEIKGSVPVAFIVEHERDKTTEEEIKQFFFKHGAPYAYPRRVFFVEALPLNGSGKVDRIALNRMAREKQNANT